MALLKIAGLGLLLSQSDVVAVEMRAGVDTKEAGTRSVGWIAYAQQRWPVYCLSDELSLLFQVPAGRRACVLLARNDGYVGVLCDDIRTWQAGPEPVLALPDAMGRPGGPILGLMALGTGIACITSAQALTAHIDRQVIR